MREFLKTKGYKVTQQRELIFRAFFESGRHVSVEELYERVRAKDNSIGHSTVWRNLKLLVKVGLVEEVNLGDGVTRYDRITKEPHGHLFCLNCNRYVEFDVDRLRSTLSDTAANHDFVAEGFKIEIQGYCQACQKKMETKRGRTRSGRTADAAENRRHESQ